MSFQAHVLKVLIASPSDTEEARDSVERALHDWNGSRGEREEVFLLPRRWEADAVPRMGNGDGQTVINSQLVDNADIVVGIFNSKLGSATPRAISGTVEELERTIASDTPVHIYFSDAPVARDSLKSAQKLETFKKSLQSRGLYGTYSDARDLGQQVGRAIESDLVHLNLASPAGAPLVSAEPVATVTGRGANFRLIVENHGDATAEDFTFKMAPLASDGLEVPEILGGAVGGIDIPAHGHFQWILSVDGDTSSSVTMNMYWKERGEKREKKQSLSVI